MKSLPFFSKRLNDFVVDEACECGHLKSEHGSKTIRLENSMLRMPHEGNCCHNYCTCEQFTWVRYVTASEKAAIVLAQRETHETCMH